MSVLTQYSNLSDYTVEVTHEFTADYIESVVRLCQPYSIVGKTKADNYAPDRIRQMFESGRFGFGFYIVKFKGEVVLTFGVDNFRGWGVITRYLRHTDHSHYVPFICGVGIPFLQSYLKDEVIGLCSTHNVDQRNIAEVRLKAKPTEIDNIYTVAARTVRKIKRLDHNVLYRSVVQTVYTIDTDLIPPFAIHV